VILDRCPSALASKTGRKEDEIHTWDEDVYSLLLGPIERAQRLDVRDGNLALGKWSLALIKIRSIASLGCANEPQRAVVDETERALCETLEQSTRRSKVVTTGEMRHLGLVLATTRASRASGRGRHGCRNAVHGEGHGL
jgi:hypothetical protein